MSYNIFTLDEKSIFTRPLLTAIGRTGNDSPKGVASLFRGEVALPVRLFTEIDPRRPRFSLTFHSKFLQPSDYQSYRPYRLRRSSARRAGGWCRDLCAGDLRPLRAAVRGRREGDLGLVRRPPSRLSMRSAGQRRARSAAGELHINLWRG